MTKKDLFGIAYVSIWILIWGTVGSLIDFPLLESKIYNAGSIGQYTTFSLTGLIACVISIYLFPKISTIVNKDQGS